MFDISYEAPIGLHNREGVGMSVYSILFVHLDLFVELLELYIELFYEMLH